MNTRFRFFIAALGLALLVTIGLAPAAGAQTDENYPLTTTPPTVLDKDVTTASPPQVQAAQVENSFPVTGGDVLGLVAIGAVCVVAGFAFVRFQRHADAQ